MSPPSGVRRLLGGSVVYGLGGVASRIVVLLLLPVLTAYLAPAEYGVVAMLTVVGAFIAPVFTLGLGSSIGIAYFNVTDPGERRAIVWSAGVLLFASGTLLAGVGWILRDPLGELVLGERGYGVQTAIAMGTTALGVAAMPWQLKLQFEERATTFVAASFAGLAATLGATLWLVAELRLGATGALLGALAGQAVGTLFMFLAAAKNPSLTSPGRWVGELLRHGLPLVPSFFLVFLLQQWARWPLGWHHGLDAVGIYSVGASLGAALSVLSGAFLAAWTPFALSYADRQPEAAEVLGNATLYYIAGFGFLCLLFFLFAVPLVQLFAQPAFAGAASVVGLSAAAHFFSALFLMLLPPLYFAKRVGSVLLTQAIATVAMLLLADAMIPRFGVVGAGAVTMAGFAILVVVQWIALRAMPVLRIRYDFRRAGLMMAVLMAAATLSYRIDFSTLAPGIVSASAISILAAVLILRICGLRDLVRAGKVLRGHG
jgi:O-antigen/teichoic acid export membrane protein